MNTRKLLSEILASGKFYSRAHLWNHYLHGADGPCLEFGVFGGYSINYMADVRPDLPFHGFDSFKGLPEPWAGRAVGTFAIDLGRLTFKPNVQIHEGTFEETLPAFSKDFQGRISRVHVDCDAYSSTASIFSRLGVEIVKSNPMILFDEFYGYNGYDQYEFKAFLEWQEEFNVPYEVIGRNVNHEQVLIQIL